MPCLDADVMFRLALFVLTRTSSEKKMTLCFSHGLRVLYVCIHVRTQKEQKMCSRND